MITPMETDQAVRNLLISRYGYEVQHVDVSPTAELVRSVKLTCTSTHGNCDAVARELRDIAIALVGPAVGVTVVGSGIAIADQESVVHLELLPRGLLDLKSWALPLDIVEEIYWANFYAHHGYSEGSTFCRAISRRFDIPELVIDLGCGDGRDSFAFANSGRRVIGLDRSSIAVEHANTKAQKQQLAARMAFARCNFADRSEFADSLVTALADTGVPALFYARFLFHSVPADTQETMLAVIAQHARAGDLVAAEFRTAADANLPKVHEAHYRRYQDGAAFAEVLENRYGFKVAWTEEGSGLSPYQDEDPVLFRVVAEKNG
jgi:SAM-dependent methyltransferase